MREIYKVAYDEVEEVVLAEETERLRMPSERAARAARDTDWATFDAAWSQLSPPEDLLVWFGSWPEGVADGAGHADVSALEAALAGRPVDRPLLAPLFAALAAEVEELDVRQFLADPGRRARIYADLARSLRPDVLSSTTAGTRAVDLRARTLLAARAAPSVDDRRSAS